MKNLITSESVTIGHPDKMCDIIADNLLDAYLKQDKDSRVAVEVMATKDKVIISGEITSKGKVTIEKIVRDTIKQFIINNKALVFILSILTIIYFILGIILSFHFKYLVDFSINYDITSNLYIISYFILVIYIFKNINSIEINIISLK